MSLERLLRKVVATSCVISSCAVSGCVSIVLGPPREVGRLLTASRQVQRESHETQTEVQTRGDEVVVYGWDACTMLAHTQHEYVVTTVRDKHLQDGPLMWGPFLLGAAFSGLGAAMVASPAGFVDGDPNAPRMSSTDPAAEEGCSSLCDEGQVRTGGYVLIGLGAPFVIWTLVEGLRALGVERSRTIETTLGPAERDLASCGDVPLAGAKVTAERDGVSPETLGVLDEAGSLRLSLPELSARGAAEIRVGGRSHVQN
jgi:hypothetical protein